MEYTIPNIFLSAFGLKVEKMYRPEIGSGLPQQPNGIYQGMEIVENLEDAAKLSYLGTPILFPIVFMAGDYNKYDPISGKLEKERMSNFRIPVASVVSFRRQKNMTATKMSGGYGTVKEIYGFDDYHITINGFFLPDPAQPQGLTSPLLQEKEMIKWDNLADSIEVSSDIFNSRDIQAIVMEELNVAAERGRPNIRPFSIRAKSDEPNELLKIVR